jgi:site-specific recombinase XerD
MNLQTTTIAETATRCKDALANSLARNSARTYHRGVDLFTAYLADRGLPVDAGADQLTVEHFIGFPAVLAAGGYSRPTLCVYLAGLRRYLDWLVIHGALSLSYAELLRLEMATGEVTKKRHSRLPKTPKDGAIERMLAAARSLDLESPLAERNRAVIELLYSSGCRNEEITRLTVGNLNLAEREARVIGKGDKERLTWFSSQTAEALRAYWAARGNQAPDSPVFSRHDPAGRDRCLPLATQAVRAIVDQVRARAGETAITPHSFRHHFCTTMLAETGDIALVQDLAGHANANTTRIYAQIAAERLKSAHRKVFG